MSTRLKCLKPRLAPTTSTGGWQPDSTRGSRHQRGYGWEWEQKRRSIKLRAKDLCEPHLEQGQVHRGQECDHKVSKAEATARGWSKAQTDDESNLQWVCTEYHREKTSRESKRGGG